MSPAGAVVCGVPVWATAMVARNVEARSANPIRMSNSLFFYACSQRHGEPGNALSTGRAPHRDWDRHALRYKGAVVAQPAAGDKRMDRDFDEALLEKLVCPATRTALRYDP